MSRLPVTLDDAGFRELAAEAKAFVDKVGRIEQASRERRAGEQEAIPAHVVLMLYEGARRPTDG
jgi:hypothetical protein